MTVRYLYRRGKPLLIRSWMPLAMFIPGWISFCFLQWFGVRLSTRVGDDGICRVTGIHFAWPLTRWMWMWHRFDEAESWWRGMCRGPLRLEMVVPMFLSLPTLAGIAAALWWLL